MIINCSIVGATSYTGHELIRILSKHPNVRLKALTTRSEQEIPVKDAIPSLGKASTLVIRNYSLKEIEKVSDVIFLTLPHLEAAETGSALYEKGKVVIDLSADFRLKNAADYEKWYGKAHSFQKLLKVSVYGLPEVNRDKIKKANLIANPGCYPTGAALGLIPLVREGLIDLDSIIIDAKSGVSGAGRKLSEGTHFVEVNENFGAYKVGKHQHTPEIEQTLSLEAGKKINVTFTPHLLPLTRGILSTIYVDRKKAVTAKKIESAFQEFADNEPFVRFLGLDRFPSLKQVQGSNFCNIGVSVDADSNKVIIITAIDNLVKGASGQAVQNMNIRFGLPEETALLS